MRISQSRMIRPMSFWGSAVAGLALTFVAPAFADDAPEKPATAAPVKKGGPGKAEGKAKLSPGLKNALENRKERLAKGEGKPDGKSERGKGDKGKGDKGSADRAAHPMKKGPDGKPVKGKKRPAVSPKVAKAQYGKALAQLEAAEAAKAAADAGSPEDAAKAQKELKAAQRAVKSAQNAIRAAHRGDAKKLKGMSPPERKKLDLKLQMRAKKLSMDRKERSAKRQDELSKELGAKLKLAPVRAELELHAWRVARLERLAAIAEAAGRPDAAKRANELLEKENSAHSERLKDAAAKGKASGATKPAASPAAKTNPVAATPPAPQPAPAPKKEAAQ